MKQYSDNALKAIKAKWLRHNETIEDMHRRVSKAIAKNTRDENRYFDFLASGRFYPNSPCMINAGLDLGMLSACFVLPLKDDMGKEKNGIFDTLRNAALIQQAGGGIGFDFSALRPEGATVHSSGGESSGPIGFMKVYNSAFSEIAQGGVRRGANIAIMRYDHPDIEKFIDSKSEEGSFDCFNISVAVDEELIYAAGSNGNIQLKFDGKVYGDISARELLKKISIAAHRNGEPGIIFIDTMNSDNPFPYKPYSACNPCGEMPLHPFDSCNLGHLDLRNYAELNWEEQVFDWNSLRDDIRIAVRFLDDVIDANKFVPSVPELEETALSHRRIGLGIMGLADVLVMFGFPYDSVEANVFAAQLMSFIRYHAMLASAVLARERGPFPSFDDSIYSGMDYDVYFEDISFFYPELDWSLLNGEKLRNSSFLTIAPTGTTGTVAGVEGYGCEPIFALAYTRTMLDGGKKKSLRYVNSLFSEVVESLDFSDEEKDYIYSNIDGGCQHIDILPQKVKDVFVTSGDISIHGHLAMQASLQAYCDSAISKTINCSSETTSSDIYEAILTAHQIGCKGVTFYVDGSRDEVVLDKKQKCPMCDFELVHREGCVHCPSCGWGQCSI